MTELYREYWRCGGCLYYTFFWWKGYRCTVKPEEKERNPGWFGCYRWISKKQPPLRLERR